MCTHNLNEADQLCDRIGIFKTRLIKVDTPGNLRREIFGRKVVFHLREPNSEWKGLLLTLEGVLGVECVDNKLVVSLEDPERTNPQIIRLLVERGADVLFVGELRHSLEDVYLQMMQEPGGKAETA
jgi:ABC-2 type transport system ATP-binding protein